MACDHQDTSSSAYDLGDSMLALSYSTSCHVVLTGRRRCFRNSGSMNPGLAETRTTGSTLPALKNCLSTYAIAIPAFST